MVAIVIVIVAVQMVAVVIVIVAVQMVVVNSGCKG